MLHLSNVWRFIRHSQHTHEQTTIALNLIKPHCFSHSYALRVWFQCIYIFFIVQTIHDFFEHLNAVLDLLDMPLDLHLTTFKLKYSSGFRSCRMKSMNEFHGGKQSETTVGYRHTVICIEQFLFIHGNWKCFEHSSWTFIKPSGWMIWKSEAIDWKK